MSADDEKYARYGLGGNPFRRTTENSVETVSRVHANLSIDDQLASLKEEVFFKRKSHSVILVGDKGMGKTHRVMVAHAEAVQNNLFSRVITFSRKNRPAMYQFVKAFLPKGSALFSNDKWQRELAKVKKEAKKGSYQPQIVAQHVASALNKNTPSFVLIDTLDDVQILSDNQDFLEFLFHLSSLLQPGVFVMVTMSASFGAWLLKQYPQVKNLVHFMYLQPLTAEEAEQVIGKWLESFRLVDGLHSLFPFSHDAVSLLNSQSHGNVSTLLDLSDMALTAAAFQKAVVITDLSVKEALLTVKEKKPAMLGEKQKLASVSPELSSLIQQKPVTDSERVSESSVTPVPATGVLAADDTRSDNDKFSSDIIDLTNNEGGSEKEIQGEQVDENMSSFSKESPNEHMKDINLNSPPVPQEIGKSTDYQLMDDNTLVDQSHQKDEWTQMKNDDMPLVSQDDNGSKTRSNEPASIMHQVKQDQELKKKEKVDDQSDETSTDTWEPVDDEESIDDKQVSSDAESVEEPGSEHESVSSDETKEEEITEPKDGSAKTDEELEREDSSDTFEDEQDQFGEGEQDSAGDGKESERSLPHPITDSEGKEGDDEASSQVKQNTEEKQDKATASISQEKNPQNDTSDASKQSHQIKQHRPQVTQHNEQVHPHQVNSAKQVLRVRCPECSNDFTIELDEHTRSLTCPFCGFQGEL